MSLFFPISSLLPSCFFSSFFSIHIFLICSFFSVLALYHCVFLFFFFFLFPPLLLSNLILDLVDHLFQVNLRVWLIFPHILRENISSILYYVHVYVYARTPVYTCAYAYGSFLVYLPVCLTLSFNRCSFSF